MLQGCKRDICVNIHCKNNPNFKHKDLDHQKLLEIGHKLFIDCAEEENQKCKVSEVVCHTDFMNSISYTLQKGNVEKIVDLREMQSLAASPYALSLSFMKDPSILGKEGEFGELKYSLNLDEDLVR